MSDVNSLQEAMFYQYMINNNSASTMLNAINGTDSDSGSLLSNINGMLGIDSTNGFSSILQSCLNTQSVGDTTQFASMVDKLSDVLEQNKETEQDTNSYQTVQEMYDFLLGQVSSQNASTLGNLGITSIRGTQDTSDTQTATYSSQMMTEQTVDFDAMESESDEMIDALLSEGTLPM